MKLAYADREIYYGDPKFCSVPLEHLLSSGYNDARRALISESASYDMRPGRVPGFEDQLRRGMAVIEDAGIPQTGIYEPTMAHLSEKPSVERRSEEHTSELQTLMRITYAVFCLKNKKQIKT